MLQIYMYNNMNNIALAIYITILDREKKMPQVIYTF